MSRRARLRLAGLPLHVIQRGVNRCACFAGEEDRRSYMEYLEELSREHGCAIHAYVLMTNHVHLLLTPEQPGSVSAMMKNLGQRYVQRFNRKQGRTGTLWEGRFRSSVIDSEGYLFQCHRYIETNPVRAETDLSEEELQGIRDAANGGFALGRAAFLSNLERLAERRVTPAFAGRPQRWMKSGTDLDIPHNGKSRSVPEFST
jgi:REP-associated tyrosine transposase